jgi:hypothetical protein
MAKTATGVGLSTLLGKVGSRTLRTQEVLSSPISAPSRWVSNDPPDLCVVGGLARELGKCLTFSNLEDGSVQ